MSTQYSVNLSHLVLFIFITNDCHLVYRVGGGSRLSGLMLAVGTAAIMMIGPAVIASLREFCTKR